MEEISNGIGTCRKSSALSESKRQRLVARRGSSLVIANRLAFEAIGVARLRTVSVRILRSRRLTHFEYGSLRLDLLYGAPQPVPHRILDFLLCSALVEVLECFPFFC